MKDLEAWVRSVQQHLADGKVLLELLPLTSSLPLAISSEFPLLLESDKLVQQYSEYYADNSAANLNKYLNVYIKQTSFYDQPLDAYTRLLLSYLVSISKIQDGDDTMNARKLTKDNLNKLLTLSLKQQPNWSLVLHVTNCILQLTTSMDAIDQGLHVINGQVERFAVVDGCCKQDRVVYWWYCGRANFEVHNFALADLFFSKSLSKLHPSMSKHRLLILKYLIVCRLVRGCPPSKELLRRNDLMVFWPLVECWMAGNFKSYNVYLESVHEYLVENCLYIILKHRTKLLLYRNLFARIHSSYGANNIPISMFSKVTRLMFDESLTEEDVESMIVSLVDQVLIVLIRDTLRDT